MIFTNLSSSLTISWPWILFPGPEFRFICCFANICLQFHENRDGLVWYVYCCSNGGGRLWFAALIHSLGLASKRWRISLPKCHTQVSDCFVYLLLLCRLNIVTAVQGKDALVEKFRNSPVMLNHSDNRPKVSLLASIWDVCFNSGIAIPYFGSPCWSYRVISPREQFLHLG